MLVNDSREYLTIVSYSCKDGYQLIGRSDLICDIDGRWNGPPPRCERNSFVCFFCFFLTKHSQKIFLE